MQLVRIEVRQSIGISTFDTLERLQGLRRKVHDSADCRDGLVAFREKRLTDFAGHPPASDGGNPRRAGEQK